MAEPKLAYKSDGPDDLPKLYLLVLTLSTILGFTQGVFC